MRTKNPRPLTAEERRARRRLIAERAAALGFIWGWPTPDATEGELAEVLAMPWATEEPQPHRKAKKTRRPEPVRVRVTVRRQAVAAMSVRRPPPSERKPGAAVHYSEKYPQPYREGTYDSTDGKGRILVIPKGGGDPIPINSARVRFLDEEAAARKTLAPPPEQEVRAATEARIVRRTVGPAEAALRAVERLEPPERSPVYMEWVRKGACVNCNAPPRNDPHHEDSHAPNRRKGVGRKPRDTLCISLCRDDHRIYTGVPGQPPGCLPAPQDSGRKGKLVLRSRAESLDVLHAAQERRLRRAIDLLPPAWRIEALSKAVALVPEDVKRRALLGDGPAAEEAEERLVEALDETAAEPVGGVP